MRSIAIAPSIAIKHILVATDFSEMSVRALDYATSFARRYGAHMELAHVTKPHLGDMLSAKEETRTLLTSRLKKVASQIGHAGIEVGASLAEGEIGAAIHDLVLEHEVDMVVAGTHGKGELQRLAIGSGAEQIFREVPCPVLTIGPQVVRRPESEIYFRHILYATDFTAASAQAAPLAVSLAEEYRSRLTLVHVVPQDIVDLPEIERHAEYYRDELRKLTSLEVERWCRPNFLTEYGDPGETIADFARDNEVDLIVLGAKKSSAMAHRAFSGTAYNVVCKALCPVLTVRGR